MLPNQSATCADLVEVSRGPIIESRHTGHLIAVDGRGAVICSLGTPETVTYLRSSGKPFQALPVVASGAADRFRFTEQEVAIACGSHNGEPIHVETVRSMLEKIGLNESALKCGAHEPYSVDVAREMIRKNEPPRAIQNNCSGKHAAMLALAKHLGARTESYDELSNPVQQMILQTVSDFSGVPVGDIAIGIDGCGVPVFGISVQAMALMYARLVSPPSSMSGETRAACKRIVKAMAAFPTMIGGTKDRLDTDLIRAAEGKLISKVGAEGVYTVGVLPSADWPNGIGLALKVEDGDSNRARPPAVLDALRQLGVLSQNELDILFDYSPIVIKNRRGDRVGEARAAFTLDIKRSRMPVN
ncbi:MAG TPA: asparaginase [Pyrinomonadaceae bacterium]|jgi:L-asparaginase II|nr:asparaginase [Pyrinomonadaceae bacterium]